MMRRTKKSARRGEASAILIADLHLTESTPISRVDDYLAAQLRKLEFLQDLSNQNDGCPILCAGDLFDKWKSSPWLIAWVFEHFPNPMKSIPGNHELPMHSLENYDKSALHLLEMVCEEDSFDVLKNEGISLGDGLLYVYGIPFGHLDDFDPVKEIPDASGLRRILLLHELTWKEKKPTWAANSYSAKELLDRFGDFFDLIVTGDNHESFVVKGKSALLVNPGSMMRMTADQADFQPRCFLYYADANEITPVEFPIEEGVHSREHLDRVKERDERIEAYIERMKSNWKGGLSFEENLREFFSANKTPKKVRDLIWRHMEGEEI
jgi:DNA repair exonuclease SbcCD nuclease subunit